jgi:glycosyltransferase involved in cell wall biosynthesis
MRLLLRKLTCYQVLVNICVLVCFIIYILSNQLQAVNGEEQYNALEFNSLAANSTTTDKPPESISDSVLFENWKIYLALAGVKIYRWSVFIFLKIIPSMFYKQIKFREKTPELVESGEYIDENDVTVVIPVYNPPARFRNTLESIMAFKPKRLIVVCTVETMNCDKAEAVTNEMSKIYPEIEFLWEKNPKLFGKRDKLITGIKAVNTKITILTDDDVSWDSPDFLKKVIAPFQSDPRIGGVGCKQVARINGFCDGWGVMADMRLAVRFLELMATTTLDKGCACISGRTACYRTEIIKSNECYDYLAHENFCGLDLASGDDKCLTRFVVNQGYLTYHQLRDSCELTTTFETGWAFFEQLKRWSRNTWRSDLTALFRERHIWRRTPWTAFILLDKMTTPFFMIYGISYLPYRLIADKQYPIFIGWIAWLLFSRVLKLSYYFADTGKLKYIVYVPLFLLFQYVAAIIKIWTLLTMNELKWGSKNITIKNGVAVTNNEIIKSINYDDAQLQEQEQAQVNKEDKKNNINESKDVTNEEELDEISHSRIRVIDAHDNALEDIKAEQNRRSV